MCGNLRGFGNLRQKSEFTFQFWKGNKSKMSLLVNITIEKSTFTDLENDHFKGVYSNSLLNYGMFITYLIGLINCFPLGLISWFEKTGQAGPFRTLRNRLVSFIIDHVSKKPGKIQKG